MPDARVLSAFAHASNDSECILANTRLSNARHSDASNSLQARPKGHAPVMTANLFNKASSHSSVQMAYSTKKAAASLQMTGVPVSRSPNRRARHSAPLVVANSPDFNESWDKLFFQSSTIITPQDQVHLEELPAATTLRPHRSALTKAMTPEDPLWGLSTSSSRRTGAACSSPSFIIPSNQPVQFDWLMVLMKWELAYHHHRQRH